MRIAATPHEGPHRRQSSVYDDCLFSAADVQLRNAFYGMKLLADSGYLCQAFEPCAKIYSRLLNDPEINYSTQVYAALCEIQCFAADRGYEAIQDQTWQFIRSRLERGVSEDEELSVIVTVFVPIIEHPRYNWNMCPLMQLYNDDFAKHVIEDAYQSTDEVLDLTADLRHFLGKKSD